MSAIDQAGMQAGGGWIFYFTSFQPLIFETEKENQEMFRRPFTQTQNLEDMSCRCQA